MTSILIINQERKEKFRCFWCSLDIEIDIDVYFVVAMATTVLPDYRLVFTEKLWSQDQKKSLTDSGFVLFYFFFYCYCVLFYFLYCPDALSYCHSVFFIFIFHLNCNLHCTRGVCACVKVLFGGGVRGFWLVTTCNTF